MGSSPLRTPLVTLTTQLSHRSIMCLDIKMQSILLTNFTFITRFVYVNLCTWHLHIINVRVFLFQKCVYIGI